MEYEVVVLASAARALRKLDRSVARRIARRIDRLAQDPRPPDARPLKGEPVGVSRVRVGDWRILYRVEDEVLTVLVIDVGHRSSIYRR
jgi:mRNA interferase RelE/StbE